MPMLTRWAGRAALIYLLAGVVAEVLYRAEVRWSIWPPLAVLNPVYIHLLVVGWLIQLALGGGCWILPRQVGGARGRAAWVWASFGMSQAGLALVVFSLLGMWIAPAGQMLTPGIILLALGVGAFAMHALPRIRATAG